MEQAFEVCTICRPQTGSPDQSLKPLCYISLRMSTERTSKPELYCPKCAAEVTDPLTCGDCGAVICRKCGTPLETADELGMG